MKTQNKTLFVTGGTGPFKNAINRVLHTSHFKEIRIFLMIIRNRMTRAIN